MSDLSSGLILTQEHLAQMRAEVASRATEEACGLLAGQGNHVQIVIPVTNILHDPFRFRMDPQEELNAFLLAERQGYDILAIYHSHPHGISRPSLTDFAELTFPGIVYLVWYQEMDIWQCRGYYMQSASKADEIPLIISTK